VTFHLREFAGPLAGEEPHDQLRKLIQYSNISSMVNGSLSFN